MVARQNPPGPGLEPVTMPYGKKPPANTISAALTSHTTTPKSPILAPSYQAPPSLPPYSPSPTSFTGPKPFGAPSNTKSTSGSGAGGKGTSSGQTTAPRRGRGVLNPQNLAPGARVPLCGQCYQQIRGPFITALGKIWCPDHFVCVRPQCKRPLQDIGFVEEDSGLYCEYCFEQFLAPNCHKCSQKIKGDCLNAIGRHYHPECFTCAYCGKLFGNNPFFLEEGLPYCENDWNDLFTTKCFACGFPIEAGDRWVEALSNNYHSLCFNCSVPSCKKNLEGQSFFAKVCVERGWREYDCSSLKDNWNLWWRTSGFPVSHYKQLRNNQYTNHIPKASSICRKDQLTRYLKSMKKIFGSIYNFSPDAYNLPLEYTKLVAECSRQARNSTYENPDNVWICKPVGQSQGRGILLFQRLSELVYESNAVVQQYVKNPLLIGGYKFDLRLYVCVPSFHPLTIYVYREGLARFGTDKFSLANLDNPFAHLTNSSLNKLGPGYGATKERVGSGCKWSLSQLRQYLNQNNIHDWLLWQRISSIIILTIASELSAIPQTKNCFEFFGFDILVDSALNPWLLEVNLSPALANDCEVDPAVKKPMLHDMFDLLGLPVCNTGLCLFTLWTSYAQRHYTAGDDGSIHDDSELFAYKRTSNNVNRRTAVSASLAARRWRLVKTNSNSEFTKKKQEIQSSRKSKSENCNYGSLSNLNLLFDNRKPLFQETRTFRYSKQSNKWGNGKDWSKTEPNAGNWTRIYPYTYSQPMEIQDAEKELRNITFNVAKFNKIAKEIFRKHVKECDEKLNFLLQTSLGMNTQVWCPPL